MLNIFILAIVGGILGWIASLIMKSDKAMGPAANMAAGAAGSFLASLIVGRGVVSGDLDLVSLGTALIGAVVVIGIVNLIRKGRVR